MKQLGKNTPAKCKSALCHLPTCEQQWAIVSFNRWRRGDARLLAPKKAEKRGLKKWGPKQY
jgi:hypothetical protein